MTCRTRPSPPVQESLSLTALGTLVQAEDEQQVRQARVTEGSRLEPLQGCLAALDSESHLAITEGLLLAHGDGLLRKRTLYPLLVPGVDEQLVSGHQVTSCLGEAV